MVHAVSPIRAGYGPLGNLYLRGVYPVFLFILVGVALAALSAIFTTAVSAFFIAPVVSNPFYASFNPREHSKVGVFRWPPELTLGRFAGLSAPVAKPAAARGPPPMLAYLLDDNTYNREGDGSGCAVSPVATSCFARRFR